MTTPFKQVPYCELPDLPRLPHAFFEIPELQVAVVTPEFGETVASVRKLGAGPPLLLVHGLMTTAYSWRYVMAPLAQRFTVYAMDLPGAGRSSKPDVAYTPAALADWLHALQKALEIGPCVVIGNSMGGYLCMVWALRQPEAITRLVVVHSPAAPLLRLWGLWLATRIPWAARLLRLVIGDPLRFAHRNVHYWDETLKSLQEAREYGEPLSSREGIRAFLGHLRDTMSAVDLARFRTTLLARGQRGQTFGLPLQLVYARRDPMVPPAIGHQLAAWIPDAELVWLDQASHFAHVDASAAFLAVVMPFVEYAGT